ncbi:MAG: BrnT family toxin [Magnetococcales bacterium]|nr:BrnT family toxin [Magnetococcales bacterium]
MNIEWDEDKRLINLRKHRIDFQDAYEVLSGPTLTIKDNGPYDEQRFLTLGLLRGYVVVVAHTEREDRTRIISMRKAVKHEREAYFSQF